MLKILNPGGEEQVDDVFDGEGEFQYPSSKVMSGNFAVPVGSCGFYQNLISDLMKPPSTESAHLGKPQTASKRPSKLSCMEQI